ncbi:hypothetical protein [Synechococcus sp. UW179A]|uniref:hypothetical protein n=1 Tax=Synechococcus sp. UW179A TaxID=2575510 RepID=UPI000E0F3E70|nr:hypothetical protein [Synechococcus sp. UW179A]
MRNGVNGRVKLVRWVANPMEVWILKLVPQGSQFWLYSIGCPEADDPVEMMTWGTASRCNEATDVYALKDCA